MIDKKVIKKAADKYLARKIKMINKKFSGTEIKHLPMGQSGLSVC